MQEILFGNFDLRTLQQIMEAAEQCLTTVLNSELYPEPLRQGGYLSIRDGNSNDILLVLLVGDVGPTERMRHYHQSLEKGNRLFQHLRTFERHVSSSETRDPEKARFGGAIAAYRNEQPLVVSFSGLTEQADEALMLALCINMQWLSRSFAYDIATNYKNTLYTTIEMKIV
jgi:hypothetical protein